MKKQKLIVLLCSVVIAVFLLLHSTPKMALRTHVFFMGYPQAAVTSEIIKYEFQNTHFNENDSNGYAFTAPPIEKATQGYLDTFLVKKIGILYFAEFLKDV